jgi:hypothetical protein
MELLSTTWADSFVVADSFRNEQAIFNVVVINDEVDERYAPPPGVEGSFNEATNVTEKEQSLLMTFENLSNGVLVNSPDSGLMLAADTGLAVRKFFRASNLMGYGRLQAYVYGGLKTVDDEVGDLSDSVRFFFRLGFDKNSYYEYRTILKNGWHPDNNVLIDFSEITGIKARLIADRDKGLTDSLSRSDPTGKYMVKIKRTGQDPTLTRIQYFAMGVVNLDGKKVASGEVWVDELRLSDVKDDKGMAARVSVSGNMSDLITYSFNYSTQDAFYRGVSSATKGGAANNLGSGQTKTNYSASGSIKLEKFLPRALEIKLPFSFSWSQSVQEPLLRSGTDITVPEDLKKLETNVSVSKSFRISESFNKKTKNPIFTLLLNRLKTSFNYNTSSGHSAKQPMFFREGYDATASFNMSMKKPPTISPLKWMGLFKAPFGLPNTKLYLYPTKVDFSGTLKGSFSKSVNQSGVDPTSKRVDFNGRMSLHFKIIESLSGSYNYRTARDLRDPKTVNITFNPKQFKLGVEQNFDQNLKASYSPSLFKFFTHKFDYSASYNDSYRMGFDSTFYHSGNSKLNVGASFSLKHQSLIGSNKNKGRGAESDSTFSILEIFGWPLTGIRYITDAIKPVSVKMSKGRSMNFPGMSDKASWPFRFGLTEDPGVDLVSATQGVTRTSKSIDRSVSGGSGVSLFAGISTDVNFSRSTSESFTPPSRTIKETWPEMKFNLRSVQGLWYVGKLLNFLGPSSRFTRSKEIKVRPAANHPVSEERVTQSFAPLISFTLSPLRSMKSTIRIERTTSKTTKFSETSVEEFIQSIVERSTQKISVNMSYSFRNPTGFRLPIFGRIKFESTMSLSVDVSYSMSRDHAAKPPEYIFSLTSEKTNLAITSRASYSFSSTVKGGLQARWQDAHDARQGSTRHTRELGLWVEMRF